MHSECRCCGLKASMGLVSVMRHVSLESACKLSFVMLHEVVKMVACPWTSHSVELRGATVALNDSGAEEWLLTSLARGGQLQAAGDVDSDSGGPLQLTILPSSPSRVWKTVTPVPGIRPE